MSELPEATKKTIAEAAERSRNASAAIKGGPRWAEGISKMPGETLPLTPPSVQHDIVVQPAAAVAPSTDAVVVVDTEHPATSTVMVMDEAPAARGQWPGHGAPKSAEPPPPPPPPAMVEVVAIVEATPMEFLAVSTVELGPPPSPPSTMIYLEADEDDPDEDSPAIVVVENSPPKVGQWPGFGKPRGLPPKPATPPPVVEVVTAPEISPVTIIHHMVPLPEPPKPPIRGKNIAKEIKESAESIDKVYHQDRNPHSPVPGVDGEVVTIVHTEFTPESLPRTPKPAPITGKSLAKSIRDRAGIINQAYNAPCKPAPAIDESGNAVDSSPTADASTNALQSPTEIIDYQSQLSDTQDTKVDRREEQRKKKKMKKQKSSSGGEVGNLAALKNFASSTADFLSMDSKDLLARYDVSAEAVDIPDIVADSVAHNMSPTYQHTPITLYEDLITLSQAVDDLHTSSSSENSNNNLVININSPDNLEDNLTPQFSHELEGFLNSATNNPSDDDDDDVENSADLSTSWDEEGEEMFDRLEDRSNEGMYPLVARHSPAVARVFPHQPGLAPLVDNMATNKNQRNEPNQGRQTPSLDTQDSPIDKILHNADSPEDYHPMLFTTADNSTSSFSEKSQHRNIGARADAMRSNRESDYINRKRNFQLPGKVHTRHHVSRPGGVMMGKYDKYPSEGQRDKTRYEYAESGRQDLRSPQKNTKTSVRGRRRRPENDEPKCLRCNLPPVYAEYPEIVEIFTRPCTCGDPIVVDSVRYQDLKMEDLIKELKQTSRQRSTTKTDDDTSEDAIVGGELLERFEDFMVQMFSVILTNVRMGQDEDQFSPSEMRDLAKAAVHMPAQYQLKNAFKNLGIFFFIMQCTEEDGTHHKSSNKTRKLKTRLLHMLKKCNTKWDFKWIKQSNERWFQRAMAQVHAVMPDE